jgi:arabinan endo-1,5-alpha-L-arabinosidase
VSIHYYDGNDNGNAKLDIINMGFSGGWPFLTRDWIAQGLYRITNKNSGKVWDAWGCTGAQGQAIAQGTWASLNCQKWNFTPVGDGLYRITNYVGGRSADVISCNAANGAKLQLYDWLNNNCQKFEIERAADGSHVLTSQTGSRVVEVPNASLSDGVQLALWDYSGHNTQRWTISATTASALNEDVTVLSEVVANDFQLYPNPVKGDNVEIRLSKDVKCFDVEIINASGVACYTASGQSGDSHTVNKILSSGLYVVKIRTEAEAIMRKKLIIE